MMIFMVAFWFVLSCQYVYVNIYDTYILYAPSFDNFLSMCISLSMEFTSHFFFDNLITKMLNVRVLSQSNHNSFN